MRRARRVGWAMVVLLALAGVVLAVRPPSDGRVEVLVGATDLPAGTALADLSPAELNSVAVALGPGVRRPPTGDELPAGARLVTPLARGEILSWSALGGDPETVPAPLGEGERAVALPASALGSAALTLPAGAHVDLVSVAGVGPAALLVADAEVLVVSPPDAPDGGGLVLRVPVARALAVAGAAGFASEVRVIARPAGERGDGGLAPENRTEGSVSRGSLPGSSPPPTGGERGGP